MNRLLVASAAVAVTAAAAPAQFLPFGGRQNFNFGYSPFGGGVGFNYGGFNYTYFQTRQLAYAYNNPLLGYSGAVNLQFNYFGARPPLGYGGADALAATQAAYLYGGAGGYGYGVSGANPIIQQQQQLLAGARARAPRGDANRLIADQARMEFGWPAPAPAANLDPALLDPTEEAVNSGDALNALAAALRPLLDKRKGEPPVFPAEVLGHLRFDGGGAAGAAGLVRAGRVEFPPPLDGPAFAGLRAEAEKPAAELVAAAADGRRSDPAAADRLLFALNRFRAEQPDALRGLGLTDALAASRFLGSLAALAEAGKDAGLGAVYPTAKWANGASAADLLAYMGRQKLRFGPAGPGDEEAYAAVHRGLAGYLVALSAPAR